MKLLWWKHKKEAERLRTKLQRKIEARLQSVRDLDFMLRPLKGSEIVSGRSPLLLCGEWVADYRWESSCESNCSGWDLCSDSRDGWVEDMKVLLGSPSMENIVIRNGEQKKLPVVLRFLDFRQLNIYMLLSFSTYTGGISISNLIYFIQTSFDITFIQQKCLKSTVYKALCRPWEHDSEPTAYLCPYGASLWLGWKTIQQWVKHRLY